MRTEVVCFLALWTLALAGRSGSSPSSSSLTPTLPANPVGSNLTQVSSDPYTVAPGQHATEVEPHMLANGNTLVAAFQTGRISAGGATAIGWATPTDGGTTWSHGFLPGLTTGEGSGPYDAYSGQGLTVATAGPQLSSAGDKPLHKMSDRIEKEQPEKGVIPPLQRKSKSKSKSAR
ncbi:MAG TPA: hypothetical protein VNX60_02525 [Candidatus Acidoferrum sp.]|jgi:hypothetical protein|nr:hypothetical protein [Candidatus Acidoferrum sp.]